MKFVIQDEETGNYVSSDSIMKIGNEVWYSTHTGSCTGLEYNGTIERAKKTIYNISESLKKYGLHKSFIIVEIDLDKIEKGTIIKERIR